MNLLEFGVRRAKSINWNNPSRPLIDKRAKIAELKENSFYQKGCNNIYKRITEPTAKNRTNCLLGVLNELYINR